MTELSPTAQVDLHHEESRPCGAGEVTEQEQMQLSQVRQPSARVLSFC